MIKRIVIPAGLFILSALLTIKLPPLALLSLIVGLILSITAFVKSKARKKIEPESANPDRSNKHPIGDLLLRSGLALLMGPIIIVAPALFISPKSHDSLKKTLPGMTATSPSAAIPFGPTGVPITVKKLAANITNIETQGNLEATNNVGCVGPGKLSRKFTPADLYKAAAICAQESSNKEGAFLFLLAGAYGRFDTLRVTDKSAHNALAILQMTSFRSLDESKKNQFQASIKTILGNPDALAAICNDVIRIGPPDYFPRYMIQHGMGAFTHDAKAGNGLIEGFDANAAWSKTLGSFLHCPGYVAQQPSIKSPPVTPQTAEKN